MSLVSVLDGIPLHLLIYVGILPGFRQASDVQTEVSIHDALPSWVVLLVEILLDARGAVHLDAILLELCDTIGALLLHVPVHNR